jgi:hypothetical protein
MHAAWAPQPLQGTVSSQQLNKAAVETTSLHVKLFTDLCMVEVVNVINKQALKCLAHFASQQDASQACNCRDRLLMR